VLAALDVRGLERGGVEWLVRHSVTRDAFGGIG
jgi:hypothetical protein